MKRHRFFMQAIIVLLFGALLMQIPLTTFTATAEPAALEETESTQPQTAKAPAETVAMAESLQTADSCTFDVSQYTLVAENESCGVKLYTRMLNGVPTDDFYLEFYNMEGEYTGMQKSSYTLDEATVSQFETEHAAFLEGKTAAEKENLAYTYINGELHLTTREVCESENGVCTTVYTDAVSGETLQ